MQPAEHHLAVTRTARYATLGEPGPATRDVWFVLHGHGQLARRFLRPFTAIAAPERVLVAPEGLSRFYLEPAGAHGPQARVGATWMTREDRLHEMADYIAWLDDCYAAVFQALPRGAVRVTALGFSQGVATLVRWATRGRARLDRLVLWGGPLPAETGPGDRARLAAQPIVRVVGDADPVAPPAAVAGETARFAALGLVAPLETFPGGHEIDSALLQRLAAW